MRKLRFLSIVGLMALATRAASAQADRVTDGLLALYTFDETAGTVVHDRSERQPPLDLTIDDAAATRWEDGALVLTEPVVVAGEQPAERLTAACQASGEATIEAWLSSADATQGGPARVVTLSRDPYNRNFTLGQERSTWDVRFRTTATGNNGTNPSLSWPAPRAGKPRLAHVVYTREADGKARLYIDGKQAAEADIPGDMKNWDPDYYFALGNEVEAPRPWHGEIHLAAIYEIALTPEEVLANYEAGRVTIGTTAEPALSAEPLALYTFTEGEGTTIHDRSEMEPKLDLRITEPDKVAWLPGAIAITGDTLVVSKEPAIKLNDFCAATNEFSIEAWVRPANVRQGGPARIVTLSKDGGVRNATLGQQGDGYVIRLRTTATGDNGMSPELTVPRTVALDTAGAPLHLIYTRGADGRARLYADGKEVASRDIAGDLSTWDPTMRLALANELTADRPWRGRLHLVAIYERALTPAEVERNFAAGPD